MIKMGEITCRIPSNGIKPEILYCTEPERMRLDIWAIGIDLFMAGLTVLLFAVAYWTLKQMKKDSAAQWKSVQQQLVTQERIAHETAATQRDLAREQHQTQLLITHLKSIRSMQLKARKIDADMIEAISEVTITWAAWSMFLTEDQKGFLELTQEYSDDLSKVTMYIRTGTRMLHRNETTEAALRPALKLWGDLVGNYIGNLSKWQAMPEQRQEKEHNIRFNLQEMRDAFADVLAQELQFV